MVNRPSREMKNAAVEDMAAITKHINSLRRAGRLAGAFGVAPSIDGHSATPSPTIQGDTARCKKEISHKRHKKHKRERTEILDVPFVFFVPFVANLPGSSLPLSWKSNCWPTAGNVRKSV